MALGYDGKLFVLAMDHRDSLKKAFGATGATPEQLERLELAKTVVWAGFRHALALGVDRRAVTVLLDEAPSDELAREAKELGVMLAMPVEDSDASPFDFIQDIPASAARPDIWMLEGHDDRADFDRVAKLLHKTNGPNDDAGFLVGASVWTAGLQAWRNGEKSNDEAAVIIGQNFQRFITIYSEAA